MEISMWLSISRGSLKEAISPGKSVKIANNKSLGTIPGMFASRSSNLISQLVFSQVYEMKFLNWDLFTI